MDHKECLINLCLCYLIKNYLYDFFVSMINKFLFLDNGMSCNIKILENSTCLYGKYHTFYYIYHLFFHNLIHNLKKFIIKLSYSYTQEVLFKDQYITDQKLLEYRKAQKKNRKINTFTAKKCIIFDVYQIKIQKIL